MHRTWQLRFPPFRLDRRDARLLRGDEPVALGGKAFDLLCYLSAQPGELASKDELLDAIWARTEVSEAALTTAMRELRQALDDPARQPRFIETVHGRGYRFIADLDAHSTPPMDRAGHRLAGRKGHWQQMLDWLDRALAGQRCVGLLEGEAGMGKSALAEALATVAAARGCLVASGQCIAEHGSGEPYLPLVDAFGGLSRGELAGEMERCLQNHAPHWLHATDANISQARILLEISSALDQFCARRTLLLLLEDMHWADAASWDWLCHFVRRHDPAHILVLATWRPSAIASRGEALEQRAEELRAHGHGLQLMNLEATETTEWLSAEARILDAELAQAIHQRSQGHPLYLRQIVWAMAQGRPNKAAWDAETIRRVLPDSARAHIREQLAQLQAEDQRLIEAASLIGSEFEIALLAAALGRPEKDVEADCDRLIGTILCASGTAHWPDGTLTARYAFSHDLWRETIAAGLRPTEQARLHLAIAERLELGYQTYPALRATVLAVHFEAAQDAERAVRYRQLAAQMAVQRGAYELAEAHLQSALERAASIVDPKNREQLSLSTSLALAGALQAIRGWASPAARDHLKRSRHLARQLGDVELERQALTGMITSGLVRGELRRARALSEDLLALSQDPEQRVYRMLARMELGGIDQLAGPAASALAHFEAALSLFDPNIADYTLPGFGCDIVAFSMAWSSHALAMLGRAAEASERAEAAVLRAREIDQPFSLAGVAAYAAVAEQMLGQPEMAAAYAATVVEASRDHSFPYYRAWADIIGGWAGRDEAGLLQITEGLANLEQTGGRRSLAYFHSLRVDALLALGHRQQAQQALRTAMQLAESSEERWWDAELRRLASEISQDSSAKAG